jgi:hypothetical protein
VVQTLRACVSEGRLLGRTQPQCHRLAQAVSHWQCAYLQLAVARVARYSRCRLRYNWPLFFSKTA